MYKAILLFLYIFILSKGGISQTNQQKKYHPPLDIPLVLAANFGELRPNHFHMGVDFKTNGVEGLKLHAIEEGFISRVKVSPYGYGKVVYIDHPNGITSVYAHCSSFKGKLDSIVKLVQQKEQNFEIEIYFAPNDIPVKRGEVFALSGNSGSSTAPHLHFEIRDTKTEEALNPLVYGFEIADHRSPVIKGLKVYSLTQEGFQIPGKSKTVPVHQGKFGYYIGGDILQIPADYCSEHGGIGFSFDVIDYYDGAMNVCGLYGSALKQNSDTVFCQQIDAVSFDHSRYVNSHKDFHEYKNNKRKYHKSFRTQHNPLGIYPTENLGIIHLKPGDSSMIYYSTYDIKRNRSELKFKLKVLPGSMTNTQTIFPSSKYFFPDSSYTFTSETVEFTILQHTFYEPTLKNLSLRGVVSLGDPKQPIQYPILVKMKVPTNSIPKEKYYIAVSTSGGRIESLETTREGDWFSAESKYLGTFFLKVDTLAPLVRPLNFTGTETKITRSRLTWSVSEKQTDLVDYDLYIDGQWVLLEYESKGDYLFFDKIAGLTGTHTFEVIVRDTCGNLRSWKETLNL